jgi:hypothetical protein
MLNLAVYQGKGQVSSIEWLNVWKSSSIRKRSSREEAVLATVTARKEILVNSRRSHTMYYIRIGSRLLVVLVVTQ